MRLVMELSKITTFDPSAVATVESAIIKKCVVILCITYKQNNDKNLELTGKIQWRADLTYARLAKDKYHNVPGHMINSSNPPVDVGASNGFCFANGNSAVSV